LAAISASVVAPGVRLMTTAGFPVAYKVEAEKDASFWNLVVQLNWPFVLPSALFVAERPSGSGLERTGF
jgi:uncharacterized protein